MKFRDGFDYYQNRQAWEEHCLNTARTDYHSLNSDEKTFLRLLDDQLRQLENKYSPIMDAKLQELQARVDDPSDWMMEFNLDFVITFYLREDDPEYEENDDNILMEIKERFFRKDPLDLEWGFGSTKVNHAVPSPHYTDEHHCYLYHQLYDHERYRAGFNYVRAAFFNRSG